jgi:hypothetical protein
VAQVVHLEVLVEVLPQVVQVQVQQDKVLVEHK